MKSSSIALWASLASVIIAKKPLLRPRQNPSQFNEAISAQGLLGSHFGHIDVPSSFDYVIVGGGTAGLTMALRLAESNTVAVIEAGGYYEMDNGNYTEIPADASWYLGKDPALSNPLIDWMQMTTPQPGFNNVTALFPQGHTLGGGSTRNFMWYQRGPAAAYQMWANAVGDQSYTFGNLLPYFQKSVQLTPMTGNSRVSNSTPSFAANMFSSTGGPLQVSWPKFASPSASWLAKGMEAIGMTEVSGGMQDGNLFGWTWIANTIDPVLQTRSTSESSMLRTALNANDNLVVFRETLGKKIIFDENLVATGVQVETSGVGSGSTTYVINATKEVIVSSGSFRSPQLLMVSGIGPAATLQANGIEVLADRPGVGQGMWDHVFFGPSRVVDTVTHNFLGDPGFSAAAAAEFTESRTGILTNVGGDLLAFQNLPEGSISNSTRADLDALYGEGWPDIELLSLDAYTGSLNDYIFAAPDLKNYTSVCAVLVSPFSRGNVTISSNDTSDHPIVNPAWLLDPRDQEVAVAAFKQARAVFAAQAVQDVLIGNETFPGEDVQSDADILAVIQASSDTIHHPAGTNRMGLANDTMAVIDSQAQVIGVKGVRVVDASAFPLLPPGHPQATVYMLAEKIADDILNGGNLASTIPTSNVTGNGTSKSSAPSRRGPASRPS